MGVETIAILSAPLILFVLFVLPVWIIMHYISKRKINQGLSAEDKDQIRNLAHQAEVMRERIQTLEGILDTEHPGWRKEQE